MPYRCRSQVKIQQAILLIFGVSVIDGLIIVGSFGFLFVFAQTLGWIALATLPFYSMILFIAARRIKSDQHEVMKAHAQVESFYFDSLGGINEILSFSASSAFSKLNAFLYEHFQSKTAKLGITQARISLCAEMAAGSLVMGVLTFGAISVINKSLLLGEMMAAYALLANMLPAVNRLVDANISLQGASIAAKRLMDLLLVEKEKNIGGLPFKMRESLAIINGEFLWPGGKPLFCGLNLSIKKGKISALWGISGAGKSTLVKILQRKYALSAGQILIDSTPIDEYELSSYRKNIAVIPQSVKIFNGTIADNILVGRGVSDVNEVVHRINKLGLNPFLSRFEYGMFTLIGEEGRHLSSGEMQLLGLVRALFDEPAILIVDEGISAIDVEIENLIYDLLGKYAGEHAVFVMSHNLRTIIKSDYVYLLEDGTITQSGVPSELLKSKSHFRKLWDIQQNSHGSKIKESAYVF